MLPPTPAGEAAEHLVEHPVHLTLHVVETAVRSHGHLDYLLTLSGSLLGPPLSTVVFTERPCLDRLLSVADTEAGSLGVPEQDYALLHHVRHPGEMPLAPVAFVEGALNLLHDIRVLIHRKLLSVVSAARLVHHTMLPFPRLLEFTV